jgi:hypothetical protein
MIGYSVGLGGAADALAALSAGAGAGAGGGVDTHLLLALLVGVYYFFSVGVCIMRFLVTYRFSKA